MVVAPSDLRFAAPLVAVDELTVCPDGDGLRVHASKRIRADDPYLAAHFPSTTVFPGVFIIEAVRQAVRLAVGGDPARLPEIRVVRSARFVAPLFAGDTMVLEATVTRTGGEGAVSVDAQCWRRDNVLAARVRLEMGSEEPAGA